MNQSTACVPKAHELPEGFVYIDELIEDCIIDAKYAGTDNFMGRPADGYEQPLVVMSKEVAEGCVKAAEILRKQGYVMKFFDAYRPQRAVDDFCRWGEDLADVRRKPIQYPNLEKARMFDEGCGFDYMDPRSWPDCDEITPEQKKNRHILRDAMLAVGFEPYECEWWHFSVNPEPYPDTYFDFPIR